MTSQEEIDLKNHLIDEICLHPEFMTNVMKNTPTVTGILVYSMESQCF